MSELDLSQLYETLASEAIVALIAINADSGQLLYTNKLANSLFEINTHELNKLNIKQIIPQEENKNFHPLTMEMILTEGYNQDVLIKKFNGNRFIGNISTKNIEINDSKITLFMCLDITIQRKLQRELTSKQEEIQNAYQELLAQNAQLKELDLAKTRFIALTTHELRTPLSAMVGSSELLKEKLYDTDEEREEFISMIHEQGLHLMELVNDILDFAKITSGKMDYFIHNQDLVPVVKMLMEQFESVADASNVTIDFKDEGKEFICYFDEVRLKQIVSNLISNAIKYNKKEGSVEVFLEEKDEKIFVYVKDTGRGIPSDQIEQVFNEFETLGKVANHQKGTGLGMPITKRLIEGMGGEIDLTSEVGVGTTFWVTIPTKKILSDDLYRERTDDFDLAAS
ncbi:MAG: HAMP domain-containing histidine kinase [Bdellovibrionales bacterium]|nr:HAMP domain-containing histidine kinase [Bdellovibrionales bacterium]